MPAGSVLLVEDSIEVREVIVEILLCNGFKVKSTSDGISAWEMITSRRFDLIIADMGLPGMDGGELLKNMRKNSIPTPVLLVSGVKMNKNIQHRGLSNYAVIYKPFDVNEIKKALFGLLNKKISHKSNLRLV
jgi:DNA-binding response OmpR family regulator